MSFKNTNKFILILIFLLLSCKPSEILKEKKSVYYEYEEVKEDFIYIDLYPNLSLSLNFVDYHSVINSFKYLSNAEFNKLHTFDFYKNNNPELKTLITIVINEKIYSLDYESNFNIYDSTNFELLQSKKINSKLIKDNNFLTSLAFLDDYFYAAYVDGKIICFDFDGDILWENNFIDIIKTPLKIHNDNIIVLLSDKILSLKPKTGELNWIHDYYSENVLQSVGGDIVNLKHLLFFILPNNRLGEIDTLFGEKNNSIFSDLVPEDSINNSFDKIHVYNNYISYFDQKKYLSTINFTKDTIILNKNIIENVQSYKFFNNSLITLNNDNVLKSFNIFNGNLYWKIDTKDKLFKQDAIVNIASSTISLFIFFESGNILQLDHKSGNILSVQKLKLKNINSVYFVNEYILINQENGKTSFFVQ